MKTKAIIWGIALLTILTILRFSTIMLSGKNLPSMGASEKNEVIKVGHLPVTCHLTCPVLDYTTETSNSTIRFKSTKFSDFPTIASAIQSKNLLATFMVAPLALKLKEDGVPIKICYLGHRDGSQLVVSKDSKYSNLKDLKGKKIAIPSMYSNQHFVLVELIQQLGMSKDDINFVALPPPDMPTSLASGAIDGFFVGEPFCAKAEMEKIGRVLYMASDIWPQFISCVLVVHEDLINSNPEAVKELVRGIAESGAWAETHRKEASQLASQYFKQDAKLLEYILTSRPQRVSYVRLKPTEEEVQKIYDIGLKIGLLKKKIPISSVLDTKFIPEQVLPADIKYSVKN
ncbi:NitT/TauT family transport system substrate-binding protein [Sphingobacterium zeae]|uniref:NitT/TauT family transport system substrate-binding protein n=1 Tax=Sphingobacterium zeae TaxID=1776859 RepID=A0ABU0UC16_9SPHI|nr:ABC transporter substrate-binding protein [Sphingobacterium zeae]MDQ1152396.1 NitT/TauT family transport system substrate-binding protein [Sphingobacterium zeae]